MHEVMSCHTILLSGLICLCATRFCASGVTLCDNGKSNLAADLPGPEELECQEVWTQTHTNIPDIDTKYIIKSAEPICVDTPITYSERTPTHGPYRPVEAESGEYLYCPPQRWLNNLKNGALVFLYHPCVSAEARWSLAALAHSCLSHYIISPHPQLSQNRPLAVVLWGRSLEMPRLTLGVCDWLHSISSNIRQASTSQSARYNLYLTKPAHVHNPMNTSQETSKYEKVKSLKHCCMEALRGRIRKTRTVVRLTPENMELKYNIKPDNEESAKLKHTDTLPHNSTKEKVSLSFLTVTQSLILVKEEPEDGAKDESKSLDPHPQNKVTQTLKYQTDKKTVMESKRRRVKTDTKAQRSGSECSESGPCGDPDSKSLQAEEPLNSQRIPMPHTDDAVWAAGALGFLLVLLTLSVLHTRLYRHCRGSTSFYWHNNQQDYENVGDIIRRRLRVIGRKKRRSSQSRRQERALLANSSDEDNSD